MTDAQTGQRSFLPLGSVVILKGSVKKLIIVSRASIVEGEFFDYGAFLYPEGMIDTNIAYFKHEDILRVEFEGYSDVDDELTIEILNAALVRFQAGENADAETVRVGHIGLAASMAAPLPTAEMAVSVDLDDPFASVRNLGDDDERRC